MLYLQLCRLPNSAALNLVLSPRYSFDKAPMSCAELVYHKLKFKDRIYRDMYFYHLFKADLQKAETESGMTEEENTHLLVRQYEEAVAEPWKLRANVEFLMLQKVLLRDAQKDNSTTGENYQEKCPVLTVLDTKRIEVYDDELTYMSQDSVIDKV